MKITNETPAKLVQLNDTIIARDGESGIVTNIRDTKSRRFISISWDGRNAVTYQYSPNTLMLS